MWNPEDDDQDSDGYLDDGIEINSNLFNNDFDDVDYNSIEKNEFDDDVDNDMAEKLGY